MKKVTIFPVLVSHDPISIIDYLQNAMRSMCYPDTLTAWLQQAFLFESDPVIKFIVIISQVNFSNGNKIDGGQNDGNKNDDIDDDNNLPVKSGARRKFIVTRMDSRVLLRPEAENLRKLGAKSNAATISFPCSAQTNRTPLSSLFTSNRSFEPHLDKRFFDTSMVRINANSTQSLHTSNNSSQDNSLNIDADIWERRKVNNNNKPRVQLIVSFRGF